MQEAKNNPFGPPPAASKVIGEHSADCWAVKKKAANEVPIEWNMAFMRPLLCDENGNDVDVAQAGRAYYFLEFACADDACAAKKRVSMRAIAEM